jgi:HAD superfamily hydrolase (TIGR01509 family)
MNGAVTFDFHNTLVRAEAWFELEVRELVAAFLGWRAEATGTALPDGVQEAARKAYRQLRLRIMRDGEELPAEQCVDRVLADLGLSVPSGTIERGVDALMRATLAGVGPMPGAVETVRELADAGLALGIVSSAVYHPFLEWTLADLGIRPAFRVVTTSASAGFYKSHPEIYLRTLAALGASPLASVHVGDSARFDVGTARSIGMRTVWLADGQATDSEPPADLILPSLLGAAGPIRGLLGQASSPSVR